MNNSNTNVRQHILDTARVIIAGKGYSAVGLNEILQASNVPKGSFYHYFGSKEAFGEALFESYFEDYLASLDEILTRNHLKVPERLMTYFEKWMNDQNSSQPEDNCLVVKLASEVSDLSDSLRAEIKRGSDQVIKKLTASILEGIGNKSLPDYLSAEETAASLYHLWIGASVHAKITRDNLPLISALRTTRILLGIPPVH